MARARLTGVRQNRFAFPATSPGFNPSHLAAGNALFSGIPSNSGIISLLRSVPGTSNGGANAPTAAITKVGPGLYSLNNGNISFSYPTTAWSAQTMAAIVTFDAQTSANIRNILSTTAAGNVGTLIAVNTTGAFQQSFAYSFANTFTNILTGMPALALVGGIPYFYAISAANGQPVNSVVCRLDTGAMGATSTANALTFTGGDGSLYIGNRGTNTRQTVGKIAAVMHANNYLSQAQLLQWAADPWSFWYPNR